MDKIITDKVHRYFILLAVINVLFIGFAMFVYGEPFFFWSYPLSDLGAVRTINGLSNSYASLLYWADMIVSGVIMLIAALAFWKHEHFRYHGGFTFLAVTAALGFFVGVAPDDTMDNVHILGTTLFFSSLWLMTVLFITMLSRRVQRSYIIVWQILYQITILLYAFTFAAGLDCKQIFQKLAGISLFLTLAAASWLVYKLKAYKS